MSNETRSAVTRRRLLVGWAIVAGAWMLVSFVPYPFVGETYGYVWFVLNSPLASWVDSEIGFASDDYFWLVSITAIDALVLGGIAVAPFALWSRWRERTATRVQLQPGEELLESVTDARGRSAAGDRVQARIYWLMRGQLELLTTDDSGWDALYRDRRDGRLWELTYPHSQLQGGGPRRLERLSPDAARAKYGSGADETQSNG